MQLHSLAFLILLQKFWFLASIVWLFQLLNFVHKFFWLFLYFFPYFFEALIIVFVFEMFIRFFIIFHTFLFLLTQVYRYFRYFLVFHFLHLFFSTFVVRNCILAYLFWVFSRKCYLWLQLKSCTHFWRFFIIL